MALVLWIMDEGAKRLMGNGLFVVSFPQLSSPMEIDIIPTETVYDSRRYHRICEFKLNEDGGVEKRVLLGDDGDDERLALEAISTRYLNQIDRFDIDTFAKERLRRILIDNIDILDPPLLPLLTNPKWLDSKSLTPFWSCSGHVGEDENQMGYLSLSGPLRSLQVVSERLLGQFAEQEILFLCHDLSPFKLLFHPTLIIRWEAKSELDIRNALNKLVHLLESGVFNIQEMVDANAAI